jgi:hypothetical protein
MGGDAVVFIVFGGLGDLHFSLELTELKRRIDYYLKKISAREGYYSFSYF